METAKILWKGTFPSHWCERMCGAFDRVDGVYAGLDHSRPYLSSFFCSNMMGDFTAEWVGPFRIIEEAIDYADTNWPLEA